MNNNVDIKNLGKKDLENYLPRGALGYIFWFNYHGIGARPFRKIFRSTRNHWSSNINH